MMNGWLLLIGGVAGGVLPSLVKGIPAIMDEDWREEAENLEVERSRWHTLPLVRWLGAGGWSRVNLMTGGLGVLGAGLLSVAGVPLPVLGFIWSLLLLAIIDWRTMLLPDILTLPLLWAGLLWAAWVGAPVVQGAVWASAAGFMLLWSITWLFFLVTGKFGMGAGDFKLMAGIGAWCGLTSLIPVLLLGSVAGIVYAGIRYAISKEVGQMPFGPFLAIGTLLWLIVGGEFWRWFGA